MTKIIVNGVEVEADPKKPLIAACHGNDVDVPTYCYHPGLSPVGSCRICQVEVQQGDGDVQQAVVAAVKDALDAEIANIEYRRVEVVGPKVSGELIQAGVTAIIQPGGSIRDEEVVKAANEAGLAMVFTGMRHFRH